MVRILLVLTVVALIGSGFIAMNNVEGRIGVLVSKLDETETTLSNTLRELKTAQTARRKGIVSPAGCWQCKMKTVRRGCMEILALWHLV